ENAAERGIGLDLDVLGQVREPEHLLVVGDVAYRGAPRGGQVPEELHQPGGAADQLGVAGSCRSFCWRVSLGSRTKTVTSTPLATASRSAGRMPYTRLATQGDHSQMDDRASAMREAKVS